jgi:hypothetical protein
MKVTLHITDVFVMYRVKDELHIDNKPLIRHDPDSLFVCICGDSKWQILSRQ